MGAMGQLGLRGGPLALTAVAVLLAGAFGLALLSPAPWLGQAALLLAAAVSFGALWRLRTREGQLRDVAARQGELSTIVESVQELLFRTDAEGRLTFVNARWGPATGAREADAIGRPLADWVAPESAGAVRSLVDGRDWPRT